jgi:hypothetical protein
MDKIFAEYKNRYGAPIWRQELSKDVKERRELAKKKWPAYIYEPSAKPSLQ